LRPGNGAVNPVLAARGRVLAHASPTCLKDKQAFALEDDFVSWTMSAAPGSECIQGLRWSYMQIYSVLVLKAPTKGKLVIVGSGFRYVADSANREADNFTLVVFGKNRFEIGKIHFGHYGKASSRNDGQRIASTPLTQLFSHHTRQ
jgi:hypothetical protein